MFMIVVYQAWHHQDGWQEATEPQYVSGSEEIDSVLAGYPTLNDYALVMPDGTPVPWSW